MSNDNDHAISTGKQRRTKSSLFSYGEPMVWLSGGFLVIAVAMIGILLLAVIGKGLGTFWPKQLHQISLHDKRVLLGELTRSESVKNADGVLEDRSLLRVANAELNGHSFEWIVDDDIASREQPRGVLSIERLANGPFYGYPLRFMIDGEVVAESGPGVYEQIQRYHDEVRERFAQAEHLKKHAIKAIEDENNDARMDMVAVRLKQGKHSEAYRNAEKALQKTIEGNRAQRQQIDARINRLEEENNRFALVLRTADGKEKRLSLGDVVRVYQANDIGFFGACGVYLSRWREFLFDDPRESNTYGGVWPCIVGTLIMVLSMTVLVVPFGVIAALYLREYAKQGPIVSLVRIAINNLAGVPSIVYGVFGLGFFCFMIGGSLDAIFYPEYVSESQPVLGKSGMIWAALTMALLTLPVVIVSTEEALAAVPGSIREASYGCGASKFQTMLRIVIPHAMPGILTGTILAMARGAGEVAPLMLVGAVHLAPELPLGFDIADLNNSFMHLGLHIYDVGFQSPDSEAARPMVYTTTLLLISIVALLNVVAIWMRNKLGSRFAGSRI